MAAGMGVLPGAYQRVEYLESTGTQYIDTGAPVSYGCVITIAFNTYKLNTSDNNIQYGWRYSGGYNGPSQLYLNANGDFGNKVVVIGVSAFGTGSNDWFSIDADNTVVLDSLFSTIQVNGQDVTSGKYYNFDRGAAFDANGSSRYNPFLFALNNIGTPSAFSKYTRIYKYTVEQNGKRVVNFIPCIRKSDSKPGMYDTVSKTFYTNAGTGEFVIPT